jgi:phospholipid/cholesterol/gamma-HCH transport system substrate-binding protein
MENKSHAFAAGAFVLLLAAMLAAMAVWLMRDTTEQRQYEISSAYGVTGLQPEAGVRYKGVPVGRVVGIALDPQIRGNVLVRIAVQEQAPISSNTFASLGFQGVTGLAFIQLDDDGDSAQAKVLVAQGGRPARIPMRAGLIARLTEQGGHMLKQLEQASERINDLLAPDNQKTLMAAVNHWGQAAASLPQLAAQADASLKAMQSTAEHLSVSAETVRNSAAEFKKVSVRMNEPGGTLDKVARGSDALSSTGQALGTTVLPRLNHTLDEAQRTVRQWGRVADTVADNPQSLILGRGAAQPGPGEVGFVPPPAK